MSRTTLTTLLTALALLTLSATAASAEELTTPATNQQPAPASTPVIVPARGITMNKVEAQFGAPQDRSAPVGKPPITRWDYPGFTVYFEHEHVVHAVVH